MAAAAAWAGWAAWAAWTSKVRLPGVQRYDDGSPGGSIPPGLSFVTYGWKAISCRGPPPRGCVMGSLVQFFDSADLTPHGVCLLWRPGLLWLHVLSDSAIGVAYYSIPLALVYFVWRRKDL